MNAVDAPISSDTPVETFGGPGMPGPDACAQAAIAAMSAAAGPEFRMTSLSLDISAHPLGSGRARLVCTVEKRARSILFVSVEARAGEVLAFTAQGLFSRTR